MQALPQHRGSVLYFIASKEMGHNTGGQKNEDGVALRGSWGEHWGLPSNLHSDGTPLSQLGLSLAGVWPMGSAAGFGLART